MIRGEAYAKVNFGLRVGRLRARMGFTRSTASSSR